MEAMNRYLSHGNPSSGSNAGITLNTSPSPQHVPLQPLQTQPQQSSPIPQLSPQPTGSGMVCDVSGQQQQQRFSADASIGMMSKDKAQNFSDLIKMTPPFKDYLNNLPTYAYLQNMDGDTVMSQPRSSQMTQQHSSSTDEGCETDHGGKLYLIFN